nr:MAG TPA: hypothetical protein [Bacteriophage sp.]
MDLVLLPYRFTLFSNLTDGTRTYSTVLLPYRFTLFSNPLGCNILEREVLLPYRFTLFSNRAGFGKETYQFYYLIDLHYSQTEMFETVRLTKFYYLIDLHYSQTISCWKA